MKELREKKKTLRPKRGQSFERHNRNVIIFNHLDAIANIKNTSRLVFHKRRSRIFHIFLITISCILFLIPITSFL